MNQVNNYRWIILFVGVLAQAMFAAGYAGIPVAGVIMREDYQFTLSHLGLVLGAMGLGVALSEFIWGILTDKFGDKCVLIFGLVSMSSVYLFISFFLTPTLNSVPNYLSLAAALMVAGAVGGSINASSGRAVMSWFTDKERGFAMSIRQTAIPIGGAIGSAVVPWLAHQFDFASAFLGLSIAGFVIAVLVMMLLKVKEKEMMAANANQADTTSPVYNISVWSVVIGAGLLTVPQMAVLTFGAVYMHDYLHMELASISIILISVQICGAALRVLTGKYTDLKGNRLQTIKNIALGCGVAGLILASVGDMKLLALILLVITGVLGHAWHGIGYTEVAVQAGVNRAGTALGMIGTTVFIAAFLTPYLISNLLLVSNWQVVWLVVGALTLLALPVLQRHMSSPKREVSTNG